MKNYDVALVYGFSVPKKVWDEISKIKGLKVSIFDAWHEIYNKHYFIISENNETKNVVIGLMAQPLNNSRHTKLEINNLNKEFNEDINEVQQLFRKVFEIVITEWAGYVKRIADDLELINTDEKIELPEIDIPSDLSVDWWILNTFFTEF